MSNCRANISSNEAQYMYLKKQKYVLKTILKRSLKHVAMRLMSSCQRQSGSGVGPESGPPDPLHGAPPRLKISDPQKYLPILHTAYSLCFDQMHFAPQHGCMYLVTTERDVTVPYISIGLSNNLAATSSYKWLDYLTACYS